MLIKMTKHDSNRLKMSSIQYAWGRLPSCIFHDQFQISSDVSTTRESVDSVLNSQDIENVDVNVRLAKCEEPDHPDATIKNPKNAESQESEDAFVITPKPREITFEHLKVSGMKCLACRHNRAVFVNDTGQIYIFTGCNNTTNVTTKTGCGIVSTKLDKHIELIDSLCAHTITSVSCGEHHTAALTSTGQVYTWGDNTYGQLGQDPKIMKHSESPVKLSHTNLGDASIVQIASGTNFNIILTDTGDLFLWGENTKGQLGFRTECEFQWSPQHLSSLRGLCIVQVACGENHGLCLTISGSVFGWGGNRYGQLGVGSTDDVQWPKKLKALENKKITTIACGDTHSVALSKDSRIYTFGNGEHGQLGHYSTKNENLPKVMTDLMDDNLTITDVACGRSHTIVNVRSTIGETDCLYSFGSGSNGQLGHGERTDRIQPVKLTGILSNGNLTEFNTNDTLVVDTLIAGGDQNYVRFASTNRQIVNSRPLLLTDQIIQNYSDDLGRWKLKKIISSVNCLNGSFLTGDEHYSCTTENCGIDLKLAEDIFTKLDEIPDISLRNELTDLISKQLIPSLNDARPDIEAMRLYLTLPLSHPFQDPRNTGAILGPFAKKVKELRKTPSKIFNKWLASMPYRNFVWLKNIYQEEAVPYMVHNPGEVTMDVTLTLAREYLVCCMELLKRLYEVNETRETSIPFTEFYMSGLNEKVDINRDMDAKIRIDNGEIEKQFVMCNYPFVFDMTAKSRILKATSGTLQQIAQNKANQVNILALINPYRTALLPTDFVLNVQRDNLVISSMIQLEIVMRNGQDLGRPLYVVFDDERIAGAGPTKEFFLLLQDELLGPEYDIFEEDENSHFIWFKSEPQSEKWNKVVRALNGPRAYTVLGAMCSLAIYNNVVVDFPFPSALFKKILNKPVLLEDLKELHPNYYSFTELLNMPEDQVEDVFYYFEINVNTNGTLKTIELIPNGSEKQVNAENRQEFVNEYVDYILNKSVEEVFEKFQQGFSSVFAKKYLRMFQPKELQELIIGNTKYDWDTFKELCAYQCGYHRDHETIKYFWEVFMDFTEEEKKRFLSFLTGSPRIPIEGMKAVSMTIDTLTDNQDFLPSVETCLSRLHLPVYKSKEVLKDKLSMAICVTGFGRSGT